MGSSIFLNSFLTVYQQELWRNRDSFTSMAPKGELLASGTSWRAKEWDKTRPAQSPDLHLREAEELANNVHRLEWSREGRGREAQELKQEAALRPRGISELSEDLRAPRENRKFLD